VQGNFIGTDVLGTHALGNGTGIDVRVAGVTIGGTAAGSRNIVSGNVNVGIEIDADSAIVQGNFIGTDVLGTHAVGNLGSGIVINAGSHNQIGGNVAAARNVISGNLSDGIRFFASPGAGVLPTDNRVQGNIIGADVTGARTLGNQQNGVAIFAGAQT